MDELLLGVAKNRSDSQAESLAKVTSFLVTVWERDLQNHKRV